MPSRREAPKTPQVNPAVSVNRVRDRLRKTEEVIQSLKTDLLRAREEYRIACEERDELKRQLSGHEVVTLERNQLRADIKLITEERDRYAEALKGMQEENRALTKRAAELDTKRQEAEKRNAQSREIILYLEAQIQELESMVALVREHKKSMS